MTTITARAASVAPEDLHPSLWRASQLARSTVKCVDTGHAVLSAQLPGNGWPTGSQTDLLVQQPGIGEMRLVAPALRQVGERKIVLIGPPHDPQILALAAMGLAPSDLVWLRPQTSADSFWAAEQVLRSASCGALLFWTNHARSEALRRLNLAAQAGETLFFMFRTLAAAQDTSPAPLRLELRPATAGVEIIFLKRRGPQRDAPLLLPLPSLIPTRSPVGPAPQRAPRPEEVFGVAI
jgi:protein ImuA